MVYVDITSGQIAAGEANKQELWNKVKENFTDLDSRIQNLEGGSSTTFLDWSWGVAGNYSLYTTKNLVTVERISTNITLLAGRLMVYTAGSAGTTEIDFKFKRGGGAWTSVFSTKPSVLYSAGDYAVSSNGVLNPTYVALQSGDLLRLDITAVQTAGIGLAGLLNFELT